MAGFFPVGPVNNATSTSFAAAGARRIGVLKLPNVSGVPQFAAGPAAALAGFSNSTFNSALLG